MGNLLTRRRELILAGESPLPEWDYVWSYSSGKYLSEDGWTKQITGTASEEFSGGYMYLLGKSDGHIDHTWPSTYNKGVMYVAFRQTTSSATSRFFFGNGSTSIGVRPNYTSSQKKIFLNDAASISNATPLTSFSYNKTWNLWLAFDNGVGQVWSRNYSDGGSFTKIAEDVDCSTIVGNDSGGIKINFYGSSTTQQKLNLYFVRMQFGRVSSPADHGLV